MKIRVICFIIAVRAAMYVKIRQVNLYLRNTYKLGYNRPTLVKKVFLRVVRVDLILCDLEKFN